MRSFPKRLKDLRDGYDEDQGPNQRKHSTRSTQQALRLALNLDDIRSMKVADHEYDMIVIGSGPGGQKAAIQAAKLGKRTAIIDVNDLVGGVCLHDGTVPSKSFREAILHLSGYRERSHYGSAYRVKHHIEMEDLTHRCSSIVGDIEQTYLFAIATQ